MQGHSWRSRVRLSRKRAIRTGSVYLPAVILAVVLTSTPMQTVQAEQRWGLGSGLGFTTGTVDDTVFTLGFNLDYFLGRNFSVGPMMLIAPTGDLFQISLAGVGRLHFRMNNGLSLVPFAGFGLTHADLDRGTGPARIDRNDTSWYVPLGLSLEYPVVRHLALTSTLIVNLHDINLSPSIPENDHTSVSLLFGFSWGP
jgi:Outer membrane protein beta-barrel domain